MEMAEINAGKNCPVEKNKPEPKPTIPASSILPRISGRLLFSMFLAWSVLAIELGVMLRARALDEAQKRIKVIEDPKNIPVDYENCPVYISGPLWVAKPLTDPEYEVTVDSVKLKRVHQHHIWHTSKWKSDVIDLDLYYARTDNENRKQRVNGSQFQLADEVKIGAVTLGLELKEKFNDFVEISNNQRSECNAENMHGSIYHPTQYQDMENPELGVITIRWTYAGKAGDTYSVIGKLKNGTIVPFVASNGEKILLLYKNTISVDQMFHRENDFNEQVSIFGGISLVFTLLCCFICIVKIVYKHFGRIINLLLFLYIFHRIFILLMPLMFNNSPAVA